ncbi:hypothetical protein NKH77_18860 [Streptomyces sp. M19]
MGVHQIGYGKDDDIKFGNVSRHPMLHEDALVGAESVERAQQPMPGQHSGGLTCGRLVQTGFGPQRVRIGVARSRQPRTGCSPWSASSQESTNLPRRAPRSRRTGR